MVDDSYMCMNDNQVSIKFCVNAKMVRRNDGWIFFSVSEMCRKMHGKQDEKMWLLLNTMRCKCKGHLARRNHMKRNIPSPVTNILWTLDIVAHEILKNDLLSGCFPISGACILSKMICAYLKSESYPVTQDASLDDRMPVNDFSQQETLFHEKITILIKSDFSWLIDDDGRCGDTDDGV